MIGRKHRRIRKMEKERKEVKKEAIVNCMGASDEILAQEHINGW